MLGFKSSPDESQEIPEGLDVPGNSVTWPNQTPVVDGVVPMADVSQDDDFFNEDEDEDLEMEDDDE